MTTYEVCKALRDRIMIKAAEVYTYVNWDPEFAVNELRGYPERLRNVKGFAPVHPNDLTAKEMSDLGFGRWSEETPMRLIPLWLLPFLADEFNAGSIGDATPTLVKRDDIDNDHRFGCLAYGVMPKPEDCQCHAFPERTAPGEWALFHAQGCPRYDGDHPEKCDPPDPKWLRGKAKDLIAEAEYFETYEPNEKRAKELYDEAGELEELATRLEEEVKPC